MLCGSVLPVPSHPRLVTGGDAGKFFTRGFYLQDRPEKTRDFSAEDPPEVMIQGTFSVGVQLNACMYYQ